MNGAAVSPVKPRIGLRWKQSYLIFVLMMFVGLFRLSLIDRGALSFSDEIRYWDAGNALKSLVYDHDVKTFFYHWTGQATGYTNKPADTTLRFIPAVIQGLVWKAAGGIIERDSPTAEITGGIHVRNPHSMMIPLLFNVAGSLLALLMFYKITLLIFQGQAAVSLVGALVYALLVNNNIYLRHVLPYDSALVFFLAALYLVLRPRGENTAPFFNRTAAFSGLLAGFGFAVYPGYYFFPVIIVSMLAMQQEKRDYSRISWGVCAFSLGFLSVLLFYEIIARVGGTHYVSNLFQRHFHAITQGSFEEGFMFPVKYLVEVEGAAGIMMLICAGGYAFKILWAVLKFPIGGAARTDDPKARKLFLLACLGLVIHASLSSVFHKMVFYGRLLHMYYPFMVWGVIAFFCEGSPRISKKIGFYGALPFLSFISFFYFINNYMAMAYPLDVLYRHGIQTQRLAPGNRVCQSTPLFEYSSPPPLNTQTGSPYAMEHDFFLINFCFFHPVLEGDFQTFRPPENARRIYRKPHFLNFIAYQYEGFSIQERALLRKRNYQVEIYRIR